MPLGDLPIERKLALLTLATSGTALLLTAGAFLSFELVSSEKEAIEDLTALAQVVGNSSSAALAFGDREAAEETLHALRDDEQIDAACTYTAAGALFASYGRHGGEQCPSTFSAQNHLGQGEQQLIRVVESVELDGDNLGTIVLLRNRLKLKSRLSRYGFISAIVMFFSCLVSLALSKRLQVMISQPILDLARTAKAVTTERSYSQRAAKLGDDECGQLVDAFNEMLQEIGRREADADTYRDHLEQKVRARTAELTRANNELQSEISERLRAESDLRHEASHDALTGLPNRALLVDEIHRCCESYRRDQATGFGLLYLDLDEFKMVNDSLGHAAGDELLEQAAVRLRRVVRRDDTVARLGGDEFAILLRGIRHPREAKELSGRLLASLEKPFQILGREVFVSGSLGLVLASPESAVPERLLSVADVAMYCAMRQGKASRVVFDEKEHNSPLDAVKLRTDLERAIEREEFYLDYQPIVSMDTGAVVGCEALLRWDRPGMGVCQPLEFVEFAESVGLIGRIGAWVLRTACAQNVAWRDKGLDPIYVAVNVSPLQFKRDDFCDLVAKTLEEAGLDPWGLRLELTESSLMENSELTWSRLKQLDSLGVRIAIDDFGTGYSSLNYLRRWPISTLKIDRSFISETDTDPISAEIVAAIASLAKSMRLTMTAEGVESSEQLEFVRSLGCEEAQGFLLGRPASPEEMERFLRRSRADSVLSQAVHASSSTESRLLQTAL